MDGENIEVNTPPNSGGGDIGAWLTLHPESIKGLTDCPDDFTAVLLPLCKWFMGLPFDRPQGLRGALFDTMQQAQRRSFENWRKQSEGGRKGGRARSESKANAVRANGCKGGRPRKSENQSTLDENQSTLDENLTTKRNDNVNDNVNETRRNDNESPPAVPPPISFNPSFVSPPERADANAIAQWAAKRLGDKYPSVGKWVDFIQRNGVNAFRGIVNEIVSEMDSGKSIGKPGAYLNTRLDAYIPPPPPPPPKTYTAQDWILCKERCRFYVAECRCKCGIKIPPEHETPPRPPQDCSMFAALQSETNTHPVSLDALAAGIGTLKRG